MKNLTKVVLIILSILLFFCSFSFILSSFHPQALNEGKWIIRLLFGLFLLIPALIILIFSILPTQTKKEEKPITTQEPPGELNVKMVKCPNCGADVDAKTTFYSEGTLTMKCSFCGTTFLVEEKPKW